MSEDSRALATVDVVSAVTNHPNADRLDVVQVRGWQCVTGRDQFKVGDAVVYCEIDSALPLFDDRFAFLGERKTRTIRVGSADRQVHPLKTIKLRGQLSQGLVFALSDFPELAMRSTGTDVTSLLNIVKYEPNAGKSGQRDRGFMVQYKLPRFIPKTDAERVQNLGVYQWPADWSHWTPTEKVDGTSTTYFYDFENDYRGTCSRNLMLLSGSKDWNDGNDQVRWGENIQIHELLLEWAEKMESMPRVITVQGELAGPGWQGNPLDLPELRYFVFRVMVDGEDVPSEMWPSEIFEMAAPIIVEAIDPVNSADALHFAEGYRSQINPDRVPEGVVWRYEGPSSELGKTPRCIKAISNRFLLGEKVWVEA